MTRQQLTTLMLVVFALLFLANIYFLFVHVQKDPAPELAFVELQKILHPETIDLWDPTVCFGMPVYSQTNGIAHLNAIDAGLYSVFRLLDPYVENPFFIYVLVNLLVFVLCTFWFLRQENVSARVAAWAALLILFVPLYWRHIYIEYGRHLLALALVPLLMLLISRLIKETKLHWWALSALAFAFLLLRASVPVIYATFWLLVILAMAKSVRQKNVKIIVRNFALLVSVFIAAAGLSAYIWLPALEYFAHAASLISLDSGSVITRLLPFVSPSLSQPDLLEHLFSPVYLGLPLLYLAGLSLILRRDGFIWTTIVLTIVLCAVAFGGQSSCIPLFLPVILIALAAAGLDTLVRRRTERTTRILSEYTAWWFIGLFVIFIVIFALQTPVQRMFSDMNGVLTLQQKQDFASNLLIDAVKAFLLIGFLAVFLHTFLLGKFHVNYLIVTLFVVILVDVSLTNYHIVNQPEKSQTASAYEKANKWDRIFHVPTTTIGYLNQIQGFSTTCPEDYVKFLKETGLYVIDKPWIHNPFLAKYFHTIVRNNDVMEESVPIPHINEQRLLFDYNVMDMLSIDIIVSPQMIHDPRYRNLNDLSPFAHRNTRALEHVFFVDSIQVLSGPKSVFDVMRRKNFDPAHTGLLFEYPPFTIAPTDTPKAEIITFEKDRHVIKTSVNQPTCMVVSEPFYPYGWRAFIDGWETKIYKTNNILRSVFLPAGSHTVEFVFRPRTFFTGLRVSLSALVLCSIMLIWGAAIQVKNAIRKSNYH